MAQELISVGPPSPARRKNNERRCIPTIFVDHHDGAPETGTGKDHVLPAVSLPNLSSGEDGDPLISEYCSPRTARRSLHLTFDGKPIDTNQEVCSFNAIEPNRSFLTLKGSDTVGSTTSLESMYTSRSLGLLSNDSDRTFYSDRPSIPESPTGQTLRRFFSNPENCHANDSQMNRSSQSWTDLKDVQSPSVDHSDIERKLAEEGEVVEGDVPTLTDQVLKDSKLWNTSDNNCDDFYDPEIRTNLITMRRTEKSVTEGRIREWLKDLHTADDPIQYEDICSGE